MAYAVVKRGVRGKCVMFINHAQLSWSGRNFKSIYHNESVLEKGVL